MLDFENEVLLTEKERAYLNKNIKLGIYKELNKLSLLRDAELSFLLQEERITIEC